MVTPEQPNKQPAGWSKSKPACSWPVRRQSFAIWDDLMGKKLNATDTVRNLASEQKLVEGYQRAWLVCGTIPNHLLSLSNHFPTFPPGRHPPTSSHRGSQGSRWWRRGGSAPPPQDPEDQKDLRREVFEVWLSGVSCLVVSAARAPPSCYSSPRTALVKCCKQSPGDWNRSGWFCPGGATNQVLPNQPSSYFPLKACCSCTTYFRQLSSFAFMLGAQEMHQRYNRGKVGEDEQNKIHQSFVETCEGRQEKADVRWVEWRVECAAKNLSARETGDVIKGRPPLATDGLGNRN